MIARDKVVGLLELLEAGAEREFLPNEINLCQTLANQAAAALDNARLFQETTARAREMAAVAAVGQAMTTLELDDVLNSIAENALEAVGAEISSVYLLDEKDNILVPRSVRGSHHEELSAACFELGEGTIGWVAQRGEPLLLQSVPSDETFSVKIPASLHIRNTLTVPLPVKGEVADRETEASLQRIFMRMRGYLGQGRRLFLAELSANAKTPGSTPAGSLPTTKATFCGGRLA